MSLPRCAGWPGRASAFGCGDPLICAGAAWQEAAGSCWSRGVGWLESSGEQGEAVLGVQRANRGPSRPLCGSVVAGSAALLAEAFEASKTVWSRVWRTAKWTAIAGRLAGTHGHFRVLFSQVWPADALAGNSRELHGMQEARGSSPLSST
jgi:hypothetical protein